MILNNNCNVGYAFINFTDSAYILDFYNEYNNKGWSMYNSEKVCQICYGRIQGKRKLLRHFERSKVMKNPNSGIKPLVINTGKADEKEVQQILDEYYRKRFKEKAEIDTQAAKSENSKTQTEKETSDKGAKDDGFKQMIKKVLDKSISSKNKKRTVHVSSKRNSQNPGDEELKLDKPLNLKRPSSDEKESIAKSNPDQQAVIKRLKFSLKNLSVKV